MQPRPQPAPRRVVPSPHGRVDPPAGNAAPAHFHDAPAHLSDPGYYPDTGTASGFPRPDPGLNTTRIPRVGGPAYSPPGAAQGYGQGGYAPNAGYTGTSLATGQPTTFRPDPGFSGGPGVGAAQVPVQGAQASPLLLALIHAMRGGYGY
jgi:hypothetical protein